MTRGLRAGRGCGVVAALAVACSVMSLAAAGPPQTAKRPPAKPPAAVASPPRTAPASATRVERAVPFRPGETLSYDISWSTVFITAGTATVSVRERRESAGSQAYYIVAEARPVSALASLYALYYKVDTLLDAYTLQPHRGSVYSDENGRKRMKSIRFDRDTKSALFEMQTKTRMQKSYPVPAGAQDALSALFAVRAMALAPGMRITIPVCIDDGVYRLTATVGGREDVETGLGTVQAFRITAQATAARDGYVIPDLALWVSADARRLPVKLETQLSFGTFDLILQQAK